MSAFFLILHCLEYLRDLTARAWKHWICWLIHLRSFTGYRWKINHVLRELCSRVCEYTIASITALFVLVFGGYWCHESDRLITNLLSPLDNYRISLRSTTLSRPRKLLFLMPFSRLVALPLASATLRFIPPKDREYEDHGTGHHCGIDVASPSTQSIPLKMKYSSLSKTSLFLRLADSLRRLAR